MDIRKAGSQPSTQGPAEDFTGTVRLLFVLIRPDPARVACASVTFEPGARTAWHTHPLGQTLIVIAGAGRAQRWGWPIEEIRPGDVIWIALNRAAPARRHAHHGDDAHRHSGTARRQDGGMDGEGHGRNNDLIARRSSIARSLRYLREWQRQIRTPCRAGWFRSASVRSDAGDNGVRARAA